MERWSGGDDPDDEVGDDEWGFLRDPDDEPDESPQLWVEAEWLPDTWTHPEAIRPTRGVDRFRSTASGMVLAGIGLTLQELLEVPREDPPIEIEAAGEPPFPRQVDVELDPDDPSASVIVWHLDR